MSLKQASEYLNLGLWTVRRLVWEGEIPVVRFCAGRKQFIDRNDIERFIEDHKERMG
jgi:excisionase family DNA binding protein